MKQTLEDYFFSFVDKNGPVPQDNPELGPCWLWIGYKSKKGYGVFQISPHRLMYVLANGVVPDGKEVHHLCNCRGCLNPEHLEAMTHYENMQRSKSARMKAHRNGTCIHGHLLTGDNIYIVNDKHATTMLPVKRCKICKTKSWRKYTASHPRPKTDNPKNRGSYHHLSKLSADNVIAIRRLFASGVKKSALAKRYGVTWQNVHLIVKNKVWKHIL